MNRIRVRLVGCGAPDAGDDSVGLVIAQRLLPRLSAEAEIRVAPGGGADLLQWFEAVETLFIVDAAAANSGFPVGEVRRFCYPADRRLLEVLAFSGTHTLGIVPALRLAEELGQLPSRVLVYAVAGSRFERGTGLSPALQGRLEEVVDHLAHEVVNSEPAFRRKPG